MTRIDKDEVRHLAQLSSISLSDDEAEQLRVDLDKILDYVDQLKEVDVTDIEPTYQVTDLENINREDEVIDYGVSRDNLLDLAPDKQDNQIKVPKVL